MNTSLCNHYIYQMHNYKHIYILFCHVLNFQDMSQSPYPCASYLCLVSCLCPCFRDSFISIGLDHVDLHFLGFTYTKNYVFQGLFVHLWWVQNVYSWKIINLVFTDQMSNLMICPMIFSVHSLGDEEIDMVQSSRSKE